MRAEPRVPGSWLRRFAERIFDQPTLDRVVLPAIADLQHECTDGAPLLVRWRAYLGVWKAMAICSLADAYREARPTIGSVTRRLGIILPILTIGIMVPAFQLAFNGRHSRSMVLLTSLPQAIAFALLVAYYFAVTLEQWPTSPRKLLPAVCAMSAALTLVMLLMTMTIVPLANQAFAAAVTKQMRAAGLNAAPATFGASEWTLGELIDRATGTSSDRAAAWQQINGRLASSTLPIMIGFVALGISGYAPKIAIFSGTWVLMLYIAALRSMAPSNYRPPSLEYVWMVNAIFTIAGLWLVWLRPRPDDSGSESRLPMP